MGSHDVTIGGGLESVRSSIARNRWVGDLFYASQIQQVYWLLAKDRLPAASKTGVERVRDVYPAGHFSSIREKY